MRRDETHKVWSGNRGGWWRRGVVLAILSVLPGAALTRMTTWIPPGWLLGYAIAISLLTSLLYWRDKRSAEAGRWRTSEVTLHLVELIGGWPAAFVSQRALRHKTAKRSYQVRFWLIILLHQAAACDLLFGWPGARAFLNLLREGAQR